MGAKERRIYSEAEQDAVLADVPRLGLTAAAKKHKIPAACVSRWRSKRKRKAPKSPKSPKPGTDAASSPAGSSVAAITNPDVVVAAM